MATPLLLSGSRPGPRRSKISQGPQDGAALYLGEACLGRRFRLEQRDHDPRQEGQGHGDQAGILEGEVPPLLRDLGNVVLEDVDLDCGTEIEQYQSRYRADDDSRYCAPSSEATPENGQHQGRKIRRRCDGEREAYHVGDILALEDDPQNDRADPKYDGGNTGDQELLAFRCMAAPDHVDPDVMRKRGRARQGESGDDREDSGKGNRADESEEGRTAHGIGEQRGRYIAAAPGADDLLRPDQHHGAEAED